MVCMRVAFHEKGKNHENNENEEDNSDSATHKELSGGLAEITETTERLKPRESGVQTTGAGNDETTAIRGANHRFPKTGFTNIRRMAHLGALVDASSPWIKFMWLPGPRLGCLVGVAKSSC